MRQRVADVGRHIVRLATSAVSFGRARVLAVSELWRTSLQFKVTASTLALCTTVVFVLIMVLQVQITNQLIDTKRSAAIAQTRAVAGTAERELVYFDDDPDTLGVRLEDAVKAITSAGTAEDQRVGSAAGTFEPVLISGSRDREDTDLIASKNYYKVPDGIRNFVEAGQEAWQIHSVDGETYLIIGKPVAVNVGQVQLYLLFPLASEITTVETVRNTLLVGGLVLLVLVAGIANIVTRQVVHPVRRAANAAARFAEGDLDKRLAVVGDDDLSKLAASYNEMAASIQRQIRQLEEFGQLQRRFTSDVSHELRTPLTTVRMAADVLHASREQFPPGLARSTELLVDELDRFESLLGDLLEISRLDAGVEELSAEYMDVRPIVERVREQVRVLAGNAGSPIELDLPETEVPADVDARRVERILRNLIANAVDHGESRPVKVTLAVNEDTVAITVRDYGVGLRQGEADLVFNRFWRADPSRNRRTGGTGLGLAISQEDARLHGGELIAWGELGEGACFRLTMPREQGRPIGESPLALPPDPPVHPEIPVESDGQVEGAGENGAVSAPVGDREEVGR